MLNAAGDGLAISSKGKTAAELMVFARYVMFSEVYWHHAVRAATCMFARAFYELRPSLEVHGLFEQTEADVVRVMRAQSQGTHCQHLLDGLFGPKRGLYKRVLECHLMQHADLYEQLARRPYSQLRECGVQLCRHLGAQAGERWSDTDILIDAPPAHREVEFRVDLHFARPGVYRPLHEVSPVVRALAGTQFDDYVKRVRVYARAPVAARLAAMPGLPERVAQIVRQVCA
jgi:HD superfamily phosphohydrolase